MRTKIIGRMTALGVVLLMLGASLPVLFSENARGYNGVFHFDPSLPLDKSQGYAQTDTVLAGQEYQFRWWYDGPEVLGGSILSLLNATRNDLAKEIGYVPMEEPDYHHWHYDWVVPNDLPTGTYYMQVTTQGGYVPVDSATFKVDALPSADSTPPSVAWISPEDGATNVRPLPMSDVTVVFNEAMNQATTQSAFSLSAGGTKVEGSFSWEEDPSGIEYMHFSPSAPLQYSTEYSISVGTGAKDRAGNAIASPFVSHFTTRGIEPYIWRGSPIDGSAGVSTWQPSIKWYFSDVMDQASVESAFSLIGGGMSVTGTFSWGSDEVFESSVFTFYPSMTLQPFTEYTINIGTGATSLAGYAMSTPFTSQFTTGARDTTPPTLWPSYYDGATDVPVTQVLMLKFMEYMDRASAESAFILTPTNDPQSPVSGSFSWNINSIGDEFMYFTASEALQYSAEYTMTLGTGAKDLTGNAMESPAIARFTTEAERTLPSVVSVSPADGSTNVNIESKVKAEFSEPMDKASVEGAFSMNEYVLGQGNLPVFGDFAWPSDSVCEFTPWGLGYRGQYTISIGTEAKDLAGNPMASAFTSWFKTEWAVPKVSMLYPVTDGTTDVPTDAVIEVYFDQYDMDLESIRRAFSLSANGAVVPGTVDFEPIPRDADCVHMQFTPTEPLQYSTEYTVAVTIEAVNGAGLSIEAPLTSTFTTVANQNIDTVVPNVVSSYPADGATNVMVSDHVISAPKINMTFSEPMDHASVISALQVVEGSWVWPMSGPGIDFLWYDGPHGTENLSIVQNWFYPETVLKVTVGTGAKDLAGNPMTSEFSFSFTTENRPRIVSVVPSDGATGVSRETSVHVTFDMPMEAVNVESAFNLIAGGADVPGNFAWSSDDTVLTFTPSVPLEYSTQYTVFIDNVAVSKHSTFLLTPFTSKFTTEASLDMVTIASPAEGDTWRIDDTVGVSWQSSAGVNEVTLKLRNAEGMDRQLWTGLAGTGSYAFKAEPWLLSQYIGSQIDVVAEGYGTDPMNPVAFDSVRINIAADTSGPTLKDISPDSPLTLYATGETVTQRFSAFLPDNGNMYTEEWTVDGILVMWGDGPTGSYLGMERSLPVGQHTVVLTVSDGYGTVSRTWEVNVIGTDIAAPVISDTSPEQKTTVYTAEGGWGPNIEFKATMTDDVGLAGYRLIWDGVADPDIPLEDAPTTYSFSIGVQHTPVSIPQIFLTLEAWDTSGKTASYTWEYDKVIDSTGPAISGYFDGQQIKDVKTTPTLGASFADSGSGVDAAKIVVSVDAVDVTSKCSVSASGFTYPTNLLSNGAHTVSVTVQDKVGNSATASWTVQVNVQSNPGNPDTTLPSIQSIKYDRASKSIVGTYFDKGSGVDTASVKMTIDGVDVSPQCTVSGTQITYSAASLAKGNHAVHLEVKDIAGNLATLDRTVNVR